MKTKKKATPRSNRKGLLPNEYRRKSLVQVERLRGAQEAPQYGDHSSMTVMDNYVVTTRRFEGDWSHWVEFNGQTLYLPGKVIDQIVRHHEAILKELKSVKGREIQALLSQRAAAEREERELQP